MFAGEVELKNWYKPNIDKKILKELSKDIENDRIDFESLKDYIDDELSTKSAVNHILKRISE